MKTLVYGVGINDADYKVRRTVDKKTIFCKYYQTWMNMLQRCYSKNFKDKHPTYSDCYVCDEWLVFTQFKAWMETQDYIGKHLDKDILICGNKKYSPDTCVFVAQNVNKFLLDSGASKGACMIGVHWNKHAGKYHASCRKPDSKNGHIGYFENELLAHLAWKAYKHKLSCELADEQSDPRVAAALRSRFAPETNLKGIQ